MSLSTCQKSQNILFSSDEYGDFVRNFVKQTSHLKEVETFSITESKFDKSLLLKSQLDGKGYLLGYVPSEIKQIANDIIRPKSFQFFCQYSAFAYSLYEFTKANLYNIFSNICKEQKISVNYNEIDSLAHDSIIRLVKDFIL